MRVTWKGSKGYLKAINRYTYVAYVCYVSACVCSCVSAWTGPEDGLHCGGWERLAWHQGNQRARSGGRRDEGLGFDLMNWRWLWPRLEGLKGRKSEIRVWSLRERSRMKISLVTSEWCIPHFISQTTVLNIKSKHRKLPIFFFLPTKWWFQQDNLLHPGAS